MDNEIKILPLSTSDENEILRIIFACLKAQDIISTFGKLKANYKNCQAFYTCEILPLIKDQNPCIQLSQNNQMIGLTCCSTAMNKIYDFDCPTALGVVTLIDPAKRNLGFGSLLRLSLREELKKRKIEKFIFGIHADNNASLMNSKKISAQIEKDAKITSYQFETYA